MRTSLFDLFKIGIGPSSSHTVGPMVAARRFAESNPAAQHFQVDLYGSLALTGRGHGTDRALLLGLRGHRPDTIDPDAIPQILAEPATPVELNFLVAETLPAHPNAMRFRARNAQSEILADEIWYSVGGGFVEKEGESATHSQKPNPPHPFTSGAELLAKSAAANLSIPQLVLANESAWRAQSEVREGIHKIWQAMDACIARGLRTKGNLPGGLDVRRRAPALHAELMESGGEGPLAAIDWLNLYALAVNEENAAGGRVVTAPTNGAAGIIPAVAKYYLDQMAGTSHGLENYFLAASAIGVLYKENASISGAEVGCQGEVGVACSMAAAGLAASLGATNEQVEHAAEIGMEHHLGMTCDPIAGLVQIPCIERNALGAVKAVNAARMAMRDTGDHKVSLDQVIETMYKTGLDMQSKYKETSLAGLAAAVPLC